MSEAKFTPGPWCIGSMTVRSLASGEWPEVAIHVGDFANRGNVLAVVHMGGDGALSSDPGPITDNARLIAAAPALYEALEKMTKRYVELVNSGDCGFWDANTDDEVIAARSALLLANTGVTENG